MAVTTYNKRCTSCGGNKWEYIKDLKLWRCRYCGAQVERKEEYDGLYTIKNVVRQVILDAAYHRMDQADRNLSECQKINARYPGTLIAGICCRMLAAASGRSIAGQDPRAMLGQIRRDYMTLTEESGNLSDDETALYEFFDSSDAWAVLAMVFDILGDQQRREYLLTLTDPSQVFSKETNKLLIRFALKQNRMELLGKVLENEENVDLPDALQAVLSGCPDGEEKGSLAAGLLSAGAMKAGEEEKLEQYLSGADSIDTKTKIVAAACQAGLNLRLEVLLREVLGQSDLDSLRLILGLLFEKRVYDGQIEAMLDFAAAQSEAKRCLAILEIMSASQQFVSLSQRQAQSFLMGARYGAEDRLAILQILKGFAAGDRMWESAAGSYLCESRDSQEDRGQVLDALCQDISAVPARDFEQYVLKCQADGERKPEQIRKLLALPSMNIGFFRELTGKYLETGIDPQNIRQEVLHTLMECGIVLDDGALLNYVCNSPEEPEQKAALVDIALKNGSAIRADALSTYLETCGENFSPLLFGLLWTSGCTVSRQAIENYVLYCRDFPAVKVSNAVNLARQTGIRLGADGCNVSFDGDNVHCTLAQAYVLVTRDDVTVSSSMVKAMEESGSKLTGGITVDGVAKKFHKYAAEKRQALSPAAEQICQERRLFNRLF